MKTLNNNVCLSNNAYFFNDFKDLTISNFSVKY